VNLVMVLGASAICDRQDVVPVALTSLGGHVSYFGMPVDPGNLMMVGHLDTMVVIGMPGCVRSPAFNGLDLVLDRLMAGLKLDPQHIQMMGVGGLLKDQPNRTIRETTSRKLLDLSA
jgi:molybdenum cofactor cytidylyltransferase